MEEDFIFKWIREWIELKSKPLPLYQFLYLLYRIHTEAQYIYSREIYSKIKLNQNILVWRMWVTEEAGICLVNTFNLWI